MPRNFVEKEVVAARGICLRKLREMAGLNSEELAQRIGVTRQTLSAWENAKQAGLPAYGAELAIKVLAEFGVHCSFNRLWTGKGEEPYLFSDGIKESNSTLSLMSLDDASKTHLEEIKIFEKNHPSAVITQVKHMAMEPFFQEGDWVGGCWREISPKLLNRFCIVEIANNLEVRLIKGRSVKGYHLGFITYLAQTDEPFELVEQNPVRVAPILRMWR